MTFAEYETAKKELKLAENADSMSRLECARDRMDRADKKVTREWVIGMTEISTCGGLSFSVNLHHHEYDEGDEQTLAKALEILRQIREWKAGKRDDLPEGEP